MTEIIFKDETFQIIGAAIEVHRELGPGFLEAVYQEALQIEFLERGIPFEAQKLLPIKYKNRILKKEYFADFFCFNEIVVEIKAQEKLTPRDDSQSLNYLKASDKQLGLIINFGSVVKLEWKRLVF